MCTHSCSGEGPRASIVAGCYRLKYDIPDYDISLLQGVS